jgi:hypothetical protein
MSDWLKINRSIIGHWIYEDPETFKAWIAILAKVNYAESKVKIGSSILKCGRGQSLYSLDTWAKIFGKNWNKSRVRRFFKLLESDKMIVVKNEFKTTRLTVCNYDSYQGSGNAGETQVKRNRNASETHLTPREEEEEREEEKERKELYRSFAHLSLSIEEKDKIIADGYNIYQLDSILDSIENYKLNKKYSSLNLTARKWLQKEYGKASEQVIDKRPPAMKNNNIAF